jgi:recombination protein RecT
MSTVKEPQLIKVDLKAPVSNGSNVQALLESYRRAFEITAPQHLDVNRVMRVAIMTVSRNMDLLECTASSLLGAFMFAVQLGLDIGAKEAHLVPFKNKWTGQKEVQLIPDYRGVAKLIRNTGAVINVRCNVVYKQDYFEYEEGMSPKLIHRPAFDHAFSDADIVGAYSIAHFKEGYVEGHFVPRKYLDKVKNISKSKTGPWVDHFAEMCRKTALKHHSKTLPQSVEIATAIELDNRAEMARPQNIDLFQEIGTGKLLADMPPDEREEEREETDLPAKQPGQSKLDTIVDAAKTAPGDKPPEGALYETIDTAQADALSNLFRDSLKPTLRKNADKLLQEYLKSQEIVNLAGFGDPLAVRKASYADVREGAIVFARSL